MRTWKTIIADNWVALCFGQDKNISLITSTDAEGVVKIGDFQPSGYFPLHIDGKIDGGELLAGFDLLDKFGGRVVVHEAL